MKYTSEAKEILRDLNQITEHINTEVDNLRCRLKTLKLLKKLIAFSDEPGITLSDVRQLLYDLTQEL